MRQLCALVVVLGLGSTASADLIAYWNFNSFDGDGNPNTVSADSGTGTLSFSTGLDDSDVDNPATGTTLNALFADPAGASLAVINGSPSNNGQWIDLAFSMLGLENLVLTYATTGENPSFNDNQWSYSTDGVTFTDFGDPVDPTTDYTVITRDFSSIVALNNAASVVLRYTLDGSNPGVGNINRTNQLDNIQLNADAVAAVPEPASLFLVGSGVLGLMAASIRRRRGSR